jgi:transposase
MRFTRFRFVNGRRLFEGKCGPKPEPVPEHQDPERLYSEVGKLKMELDWLKKKSGISRP